MTLILVVFISCTAIQLIWWLYFLSPLARTPVKHRPATNAPIPSVSVIVCAHNELENLRNLVPRLLAQDYPAFEVIIVNDRSKDGTAPWLAAQKDVKSVKISEVTPDENPKKNALVKGIEAASNDILLLTDADCVPTTNRWIRSMAEKYQPGIKIVLGYSGYQQRPGFLNRLIRYETLLTAIQYFSRAIVGKPYMGVGRNLSYLKSFYNETKGLEEVMHVTGGDDDLFVNRVANGKNTTVCLHPDSVVMSLPKESWKTYFRQKLRHLSVGKYYKTVDLWILGIFSITHIVFWSSLVSLLVTQTMVSWVVAGFIMRQLALSWVVNQSSRKLGERINIFYVPILDFLYSIFYLITGLSALGTKKVVWH